MKLSIIIPVYNAQKYLEKCLETVLACPSSEMECILINDGSRDASINICREFAKKDSRFIVIDKKNEGVSVARNTGMVYATGIYILFLDADDYIDIRKWEQILRVIEEGYDFISFSYYTLYENGVVVEERFPIDDVESTDVQIVRQILVASASLNTCWGKLMRREIIVNNRITFKKGLRTGEDTVFIMDYFRKAFTYLIRNESILYYRQHEESVMHSMNMNAKLDDFEMVYDGRRKLITQWNDSELEKRMYQELFSVITNLFLVFSMGNSYKESRNAYAEVRKRVIVEEIVKNVPYKRLTPIYKKVEYVLIKIRMFGILVLYFKMKNRFR